MHARDTKRLADETLFAGTGAPIGTGSADSGDFASLIAPLEARAGARLNGRGRVICSQAFSEWPHGFRSCVDRAVVRATVNPLGLLIRMCLDGEHRQGDLGGIEGFTIRSAAELIKEAREDGEPYPEDAAYCDMEQGTPGCPYTDSWTWFVDIPHERLREHFNGEQQGFDRFCLDCAKRELSEHAAQDAAA